MFEGVQQIDRYEKEQLIQENMTQHEYNVISNGINKLKEDIEASFDKTIASLKGEEYKIKVDCSCEEE